MAMQATEFNDYQFSQVYPSGIERHFWNTSRNWIVEDEVRAAQRQGQANRILEVGCGAGVVLQHLLGAGIDITGVELGDPPARFDLGDRMLTRRSAESLPESMRSSIDSLMFLDVLEHIEDVPAFLSGLASSFPNAKTLIIAVPSRPEAWSRWDELCAHVRRYTHPVLRDELGRAGFTVTRSRYCFTLLYGVAMAYNLTRTERPIDHLPPGPNAAGIHRTLARVIWLESKIVGPLHFVPGLSIIATAVRR
jgi:SAM-dependent methyltransferase